jgi:hypothetical protein
MPTADTALLHSLAIDFGIVATFHIEDLQRIALASAFHLL